MKEILNSLLLRSTGATLALWFSAAATFGQAADSARVALQAGELPGVTVTESGHLRALERTAPTHLIDRTDMRRMGTVDMADALHRLPGITLRDYGGAGGMKTVGVRGLGAKHTGVSYDGVPLGDGQNGEIDVSRYAPDQLQSLQLTVGDNDDIFCPARMVTTPAMLSIETLRAGELGRRRWADAQLRMGSFGYVSPMLRLGGEAAKGLRLSAHADYTYAENDYPFRLRNVSIVTREHRNNNRMNQGHAEVNMLWNVDSASLFSAKVYYYDNDRQLPGTVRYYTDISREKLRERNLFGQVRYQRRITQALTLRLMAKANWAASLYDDGLKASQIQDADYWQREYYASAALLAHCSESVSLSYAADYVLTNLNSTLPTDIRPRRHGILQTAAACYRAGRLTATLRLLHSLYLNRAKRGEATDDMRRLSPSASVGYALNRHLRLRASVKDIFRVPTFSENYYFHYGSPTLRPEKTTQWNLGATWNRWFTASVDAYYNRVGDMIVAVPYNMFVWRCVNVGKVHVAGIDAAIGLQWSPAKGHTLAASANATYQRAANRTNPESPYYGNQIAYMPRQLGAASVSWENPWANISLHGQGIGSRWTNNEHLSGTRVAGYWETGLTLWRRFALRRGLNGSAPSAEVRLDVRNLFDQQYEIVGAYPMPGRNVMCSVSLHL